MCPIYKKRNDAKKVENDSTTKDLQHELQNMSESDLHTRAKNLLSQDADMNLLDGFKENEMQTCKEKSQWYSNYLARAEDDLESVSCNESDIDDCLLPGDFYEKHDFIYLSGLSSRTGVPKAWRGAKKVAILLKKMFGGNPAVVHPVPRWLMLKVGEKEAKIKYISIR